MVVVMDDDWDDNKRVLAADGGRRRRRVLSVSGNVDRGRRNAPHTHKHTAKQKKTGWLGFYFWRRKFRVLIWIIGWDGTTRATITYYTLYSQYEETSSPFIEYSFLLTCSVVLEVHPLSSRTRKCHSFYAEARGPTPSNGIVL
eukprot:scaffold10230_cov150-Amphora_coffeaeformis.AAC.1